MDDYYNLGNIRNLLMQGFGMEDLKTLCSLTPSFRAVYENWGHSNKSDFVSQLIDHALRQLKVEELLDRVREENPARYELHKPYIQPQVTYTTTIAVPLLFALPDDNLGKGIRLGGTYRGIPLRIAATDWVPYYDPGREVRSGWLFISQWTVSHAITFFKIHVFGHGEGYIHIADVTEPAHPVYLETGTGFRQQMNFDYNENPTAHWSFTWDERWITG